MSVPTLAPSVATLEFPGPPNWLNPNVPRIPAAAPEPAPAGRRRARADASIAACFAEPSSAQCPAVRTRGTPAGLKAPNPAEHRAWPSTM